MNAIAMAAMAALVWVWLPMHAHSATIQDAFRRPYAELLAEVANQSPLFESAEDVSRALGAHPHAGSSESLQKRIAALRMLLADGQIRPEHAGSYAVAQHLVAAGEQLLAHSAQRPAAAMAGPQAGRPSDYGLAYGNDENFNFFDIIVMPFKVVFWILEKLFDIILYPFQLLFGAIF
jgi:hypothetical protein